jgi:hypothetical protein
VSDSLICMPKGPACQGFAFILPAYDLDIRRVDRCGRQTSNRSCRRARAGVQTSGRRVPARDGIMACLRQTASRKRDLQKHEKSANGRDATESWLST